MHNRLSPALVRGARGLLDWSMLDLARAAAVSVSTVKRLEHGEVDRVPHESHANIQHAFEREGVVFLSAGEEGIILRSRGAARGAPSQPMAYAASLT